MNSKSWLLTLWLFSLSDALAGPLGVLMWWGLITEDRNTSITRRFRTAVSNLRDNPGAKVMVILFAAIGIEGIGYFFALFWLPQKVNYAPQYLWLIISARSCLAAGAWISIIMLRLRQKN